MSRIYYSFEKPTDPSLPVLNEPLFVRRMTRLFGLPPWTLSEFDKVTLNTLAGLHETADNPYAELEKLLKQGRISVWVGRE